MENLEASTYEAFLTELIKAYRRKAAVDIVEMPLGREGGPLALAVYFDGLKSYHIDQRDMNDLKVYRVR